MIKKAVIIMVVMCVFGAGRVRAEEATDSAMTVTPTEVVKENITEVSNSETIYRLAGVLEGESVGSWNGINTVP